jgi:hypothetical protein
VCVYVFRILHNKYNTILYLYTTVDISGLRAMLSCNDISNELKAVSDEYLILKKLLYRNSNQHGKSSLHGQLQGVICIK